MLFSSKHILIIAGIFLLNIELSFSACARAEYEMENGECCPMCAPGKTKFFNIQLWYCCQQEHSMYILHIDVSINSVAEQLKGP